jgi:hypothetical protein
MDARIELVKSSLVIEFQAAAFASAVGNAATQVA